MGFFSGICNEHLIRELARELNTDLVLFGVDGLAYYGNLQSIEDCRLAVLTPAIGAESSDVEILAPGGEVIHVDFARVDLWSIVAKGTGIASDPIESFGGPPFIAAPQAAGEPGAEERQESHDLIRILRRSIGDDVVLTTLGGFAFEGTVSAVDDDLAILSVDEIFVPGTTTSISDTEVKSVVVNLCALTSLSGASS